MIIQEMGGAYRITYLKLKLHRGNMKPINIKADKEKKIIIVNWEDNHQSEYSFGLLRAGCPCATCKGGHENMSQEPDIDTFFKIMEDSPSTRLKNIELTGSYGITIEWEDGHHYGIYNWHYLRKLCPCSVCHPELTNLRNK